MVKKKACKVHLGIHCNPVFEMRAFPIDSETPRQCDGNDPQA